MSENRRIESALISVFHKEGLEPIIEELQRLNVKIYSTGGTQRAIESMGAEVTPVEEVTDYPSILGGRVKTLHPKVFGGILGRRGNDQDEAQMLEYGLPKMDLVIVDLYPFEETVTSGAGYEDVIEKIDIGGIALIRGAAKNHRDVVIVSSRKSYGPFLDLLKSQDGVTNFSQRQALAAQAFRVSSHYDTAIHSWLIRSTDDEPLDTLNLSELQVRPLRYGENPHQPGRYFGDLEALFDQLHGKALSYNNLLDVDAAVQLMREFENDDPTFAILKHNNACGLATRDGLAAAYTAALAGDPVSAFGGVLIANRPIDAATAGRIHSLFCEVVIAPSFEAEAVEILKGKKNRVLLRQKPVHWPKQTVRSALNGYLVQATDRSMEGPGEMRLVTGACATPEEMRDLSFALKLAKHTKSNTIVFAKNRQLLGSGTGQTSRVDALRQGAAKAKAFGFSLEGAVMASDAFFPFPDCVEIARGEGVKAVVQPGGSVKDQLSIDYCDGHDMSMYMTGIRHFRH
jgi:phosphoribosylaminoimidazolecarboxamide formyltransferase / IMP cyclohydrolase